MNAFDLINIDVGGTPTQARPTAWADGMPVRFQTTCPKCAQLIEFEGRYFACGACGAAGAVSDAGVQQGPDAHLEGIVLPPLQNLTEQHITTDPIVDPLETGAFPADVVDAMGIVKE